MVVKNPNLCKSKKLRKNAESKIPKVAKTKNGRMLLWSKCVVCGSKKSKFIKQQETSGLLSSLGIKAPLNKIPLLDLFFILEVLTN